jgi:hypothetical protein
MKAEENVQLIRDCTGCDDAETLAAMEGGLIVFEKAIALLRRVSDECKDVPDVGVVIPGDLYWAIEGLLDGEGE